MLSALVALGASSVATVKKAHAAAHFVRVGVVGSAQEEVWQVIAENAKHESAVLQIIPFDHYNDADDALAEHRIDANAFQDRFFLEDQNNMKGYDLVATGPIWLAPLTIYSHKYKSLEILPESEVSIAIPDDPTNEARSLLLLQKKAFIRLPSNVSGRPTIIDIVGDLRKCRIDKMPVSELSKSIKNYDLVLMPSDYMSASALKDPSISANLITQEAVQGNPYMTMLVTNPEDSGASWLGAINAALQRGNVEQAITHVFQGSVFPAWKF